MIASRSILAACDHHIESPVSESRRVPTTFPEKGGESIYIHTTALHNFIQNYLPHIKFPFVLVSGDSDMTVPNDIRITADYILSHELLIFWYAQNCTEPSGKLKQLPIGLDFHTLAAGNHAWGEKTSREDQENELVQIRKLNVEKEARCYSNFHFTINTRYSNDRREAMARVPRELVYYEPRPVKRSKTWLHMVRYKYVLSPHGNGLDCHRTWEALALGCIPIVKTSPLDPLFDGLPVLIVQDWSHITKQLLAENITGSMEKLSMEYWIDKIKNSYKPDLIE